MITTIQFVPGAVAQGANINLPAWAPKIDSVVSAFLIRPTNQLTISAAALQGTDLTETQADHATAARHTLTASDPVVSAVPTKVDEDTITLSVATLAGDILVLSYIRVGVRRKAS